MSTLDERVGTLRDWLTQMRLGNTTTSPVPNPMNRQTVDIGPGETLEIVHAADPDYLRRVTLLEHVIGAGAPLIPAMTWPSNDICTVSASSAYSDSNAAAYAADRKVATQWSVAAGKTTGWWRCCFTAPVTVAAYAMLAPSVYGDSAPRDWTLRGSNDGVNWTVVDIGLGVTWTNGQLRQFNFAQPVTFSCWEINITASNRPSYASPIALAEVQFYAPVREGLVLASPVDYQVEYLADRTRIHRLAAERRRLTAMVRL